MNNWDLSDIVDKYLDEQYNELCSDIANPIGAVICLHPDGHLVIMPKFEDDKSTEFLNSDGYTDQIQAGIMLPDLLDQMIENVDDFFDPRDMLDELRQTIITKLENLILRIKSQKEKGLIVCSD